MPCPRFAKRHSFFASLRGQNGALFGLDARLALGIFGVLSIVASYVAWWRITDAKEARLYRELTDIEDALRGYQTDMGTFFVFTLNKDPFDSSSDNDITALWETAPIKAGFRNNWNGPYLHRKSRYLSGYGNLSVMYATGDRKSTCTTDSDCYVWLVLENVPAEQWQHINQIVDEGGGAYHEPTGMEIAVGRLQADSLSDPRMLFYRTVERPE